MGGQSRVLPRLPQKYYTDFYHTCPPTLTHCRDTIFSKVTPTSILFLKKKGINLNAVVDEGKDGLKAIKGCSEDHFCESEEGKKMKRWCEAVARKEDETHWAYECHECAGDNCNEKPPEPTTMSTEPPETTTESMEPETEESTEPETESTTPEKSTVTTTSTDIQ